MDASIKSDIDATTVTSEFTPIAYELGGIDYKTGALVDSDNRIRLLDFIPVSKTSGLTIKVNLSDANFACINRCYDIDKNYLGSNDTAFYPGPTVNIKANSKYIKLLIATSKTPSTISDDTVFNRCVINVDHNYYTLTKNI